MNYTQLNQVAEGYGFIVVYPSAIENWNSTLDVNDVEYIDALIDTLSEGYSIDPERIYATGFSQGGLMAYKLACQLSHRIAAIAAVASGVTASILRDCNPLRPVPVLHIHGTLDREAPIFGDLEDPTGFASVHRTLNYWIAFNNCVETETVNLEDTDQTDSSTVEKTSYTNCDNNSDVIYLKVISGGHTWPGAGWSGLSLGLTNLDIDASVEIWEFFMDHQLTPTSAESHE
jgi:polyhydroxybutyrate depolymerase